MGHNGARHSYCQALSEAGCLAMELSIMACFELCAPEHYSTGACLHHQGTSLSHTTENWKLLKPKGN